MIPQVTELANSIGNLLGQLSKYLQSAGLVDLMGTLGADALALFSVTLAMFSVILALEVSIESSRTTASIIREHQMRKLSRVSGDLVWVSIVLAIVSALSIFAQITKFDFIALLDVIIFIGVIIYIIVVFVRLRDVFYPLEK